MASVRGASLFVFLVGAAANRLALRSGSGTVAVTPSYAAPQLPTALAVLADQCKCRFRGLCTCELSMEFMDCIADSCASGACECHDQIFEHACGGMVDACPSVGVQCNAQRATCLSQPLLNNETVDEILRDLEGMKARKCKLERALAAGFVNADNRLRELEPPLQARLDLLKIKGVKA